MSPHLQYHISCSGWNYSAWQGPFYPPNLENSKWLSYYSRVFDYVEIDTPFYRILNEFMVKNRCRQWYTLGNHQYKEMMQCNALESLAGWFRLYIQVYLSGVLYKEIQFGR